MEVKHPLLSKTLWTNLILAIVAFIPAAQGYVQGHPTLVLSVLAGANIVLRLVTKNAIGLED
jgi:hypothetical protein